MFIRHQCNWVEFFSRQQLTTQVTPMMVRRTMERNLFPTFVEASMVATTFYLWMSQKSFDTFLLVVNHINK
jgi:hypothetical protein